jgi:hypothetical protein
MKPNEIKELIAKGRTEQAIQAVRELTRNTELDDVAISISKSQRTFKKKSMMGILSTAEETQQEAIITNKMLDLLNEYEILQVKEIRNGFEQLKSELSKAETSSELESTLEDINSITTQIDDFEFEELSKEEKTERLSKVGSFLNNLADPESKAGKVIQMVRNGIDIAQDIATSYNSVAEWVGLPVVPRLLLKKLD